MKGFLKKLSRNQMFEDKQENPEADGGFEDITGCKPIRDVEEEGIMQEIV